MDEPNPCETLKCAVREKPIAECVELCCPHRWTRESREDRVRREQKDRREVPGSQPPAETKGVSR